MGVQSTYSFNMTAGFAGMLADDSAHDVIAMRNDEASAQIAFGLGVKFNSTSDGKSAALPTAQADKIAGIVMHSHAYSNGENGDLGTTGLKPGAVMNILRKGRILVTARSAVGVGDRLYVRRTSSDTGFETLGGLEDAADSTDMVDCTAQGVWLTAAAAGELAVLEVDFTNKP